MDGKDQNNSSHCNYIETDRKLKEQFILGLNDNDMLIKIIWTFTVIKDTSVATRGQVLAWARQVEAPNHKLWH